MQASDLPRKVAEFGTLLASLFGLVTALFSYLVRSGTRKEAEYPYGRNHNGTVLLPAVHHHPASVAEVRALIKSIGAEQRVRVVGSAKSNTKCLEAPDLLVRLDRLNAIALAPDRQSVCAGAGATLRELVHWLAARDLQLFSAIELGNLTLGAAACAHTKNRHLPGEHGILSSYVIGAVLVDADGRVHRLSETQYSIDGAEAEGGAAAAAQMLRHVRSSYGLLGVVCEVRVRVRPLAGRAISHMSLGRDGFVQLAQEHAASGAALFCYFSPYLDRYLVETQRPTAAPPRHAAFWAVREALITTAYPALFALGDAMPARAAPWYYGALFLAGSAPGDTRRGGAAGAAPPPQRAAARTRGLARARGCTHDRVDLPRLPARPRRRGAARPPAARAPPRSQPALHCAGSRLAPLGGSAHFRAAPEPLGVLPAALLPPSEAARRRRRLLRPPAPGAAAVLAELRAFCRAYHASTGYANAYFVAYVLEQDAAATLSYAADGPVLTVDPIAASRCARFEPFCAALAAHLQRTVGGLRGAFNQSLGVPPRELGRAVRDNPGARHFLATRARLDPMGRFLNPYLQEVLDGVGEKPPPQAHASS